MFELEYEDDYPNLLCQDQGQRWLGARMQSGKIDSGAGRKESAGGPAAILIYSTRPWPLTG
jgi:hypothetical protein